MTTDLLDRIADAETHAHVRFGAGGEVAHIGPLVAVAAASTGGSPLPTDTGWLSSERPPTEDELADFEAFSARHGQTATLHLLSPQAPAALPLLTARGYALDFVLHVYAHDLQHLPELSNIPVRETTERDRWAVLAAEGFGPGTEAVGSGAGDGDPALRGGGGRTGSSDGRGAPARRRGGPPRHRNPACFPGTWRPDSPARVAPAVGNACGGRPRHRLRHARQPQRAQRGAGRVPAGRDAADLYQAAIDAGDDMTSLALCPSLVNGGNSAREKNRASAISTPSGTGMPVQAVTR